MDLKEAEKMAWSEMLRYNLKDWDFQFNDRRTCFGLCSYYKKTIYLSRYLVELNNPTRVMNTIKHEIAHALVGPSHGHNEVWKKQAIQIGCDGNRCYSTANTVTPKPTYEYVYECLKCGKQITKSYIMHQPRACLRCCNLLNKGQYSSDFNFKLVGKRGVK